MKFWTVQTKEVLDIISRQGFFQPDFQRSRYLRLNPDLQELYDFILFSFNRNNGVQLPGIVFAFAQSDGRQITGIENSQDFYTFIQKNKHVIGALWNKLDTRDAVIMELEYHENFNPVFVDINDFQLLIPPVMILPPYTEQSLSRICTDISKGEITASEFPSSVIQAHLPYIQAENICGLYHSFPME